MRRELVKSVFVEGLCLNRPGVWNRTSCSEPLSTWKRSEPHRPGKGIPEKLLTDSYEIGSTFVDARPAQWIEVN